MKYAVIIKHPYRDWDYRVDVYDFDGEERHADVQKLAESKMLGPFEVLSVTAKISEIKQER